MTRGCLCIFAKAPRPGLVKTRLIPALGERGAEQLARAFLIDTWAAVRGLPWAHSLLAIDGDWPPDLVLEDELEVWPQGDGDLGQRLERVLRAALARFPFAIAIGADTPGLPRKLLDAAYLALQTADAVVGPCADGGFYLLGLKRCPQGLLHDLPWSSEDTGSHTLARLQAHGLPAVTIASWFDVDRPADLERLRGYMAGGEVSAAATAVVLAQTGEDLSRKPM